jgi:hypothetical protein
MLELLISLDIALIALDIVLDMLLIFAALLMVAVLDVIMSSSSLPQPVSAAAIKTVDKKEKCFINLLLI